MNGAVVAADFSVRGLMKVASRETGLCDFGDQWFVPHLDALINALLEEDASLNAQGVSLFRARFISFLTTRLKSKRIWKEHPEIADEEISPPVIIIGLPRTGTTKLHRMMCSSGDFAYLRLWETLNPIAEKSADSSRPDEQTHEGGDYVALLRKSAPRIFSVHDMGADEPEEEIMLMQHSFLTKINDAEAHVPRFLRYVERHDIRPVYRELRDWLKYLQWQRGGERKPWLLKCVYHNEYLVELLEMFPGARLIQLHREVEDVIGSWASLIEVFRSIYTDKLNLHEVGTDAIDYWKNIWDRNARIRSDHPEIVVRDFMFQDVVGDIRSVISQIYAACDLKPSAVSWANMASWEDANKRHKHGQHDYPLEKYGLSRERIRKAMAGYCARYGV
jgi:hypothetical protein